jgi:hypothetical protein
VQRTLVDYLTTLLVLQPIKGKAIEIPTRAVPQGADQIVVINPDGGQSNVVPLSQKGKG